MKYMEIPPWRGAVNKLRYGLAPEPQLDDGVVDRYAQALIGQRAFAGPPEEYVQALELMLRSDTVSGLIDIPHGEEQFREFARRLLTRLQDLQPWPEPPFRKINVVEWQSFGGGSVVARIRRSGSSVQDFLRERFDPLPGGAGSVLILRLASADTVALLQSERPGDRTTAVLRRQDADSTDTVEALVHYTGLPREWIEIVRPAT